MLVGVPHETFSTLIISGYALYNTLASTYSASHTLCTTLMVCLHEERSGIWWKEQEQNGFKCRGGLGVLTNRVT